MRNLFILVFIFLAVAVNAADLNTAVITLDKECRAINSDCSKQANAITLLAFKGVSSEPHLLIPAENVCKAICESNAKGVKIDKKIDQMIAEQQTEYATNELMKDPKEKRKRSEVRDYIIANQMFDLSEQLYNDFVESADTEAARRLIALCPVMKDRADKDKNKYKHNIEFMVNSCANASKTNISLFQLTGKQSYLDEAIIYASIPLAYKQTAGTYLLKQSIGMTNFLRFDFDNATKNFNETRKMLSDTKRIDLILKAAEFAKQDISSSFHSVKWGSSVEDNGGDLVFGRTDAYGDMFRYRYDPNYFLSQEASDIAYYFSGNKFYAAIVTLEAISSNEMLETFASSIAKYYNGKLVRNQVKSGIYAVHIEKNSVKIIMQITFIKNSSQAMVVILNENVQSSTTKTSKK